jgi:hypothetical protein
MGQISAGIFFIEFYDALTLTEKKFIISLISNDWGSFF